MKPTIAEVGKSYGSPFGGKGWPIFHPSSLRKFIVLSSRALHGSQLSQGSNFAVPRDHTNHNVFNSFFLVSFFGSSLNQAAGENCQNLCGKKEVGIINAIY
jgi:hypothetical protein